MSAHDARESCSRWRRNAAHDGTGMVLTTDAVRAHCHSRDSAPPRSPEAWSLHESLCSSDLLEMDCTSVWEHYVSGGTTAGLNAMKRVYLAELNIETFQQDHSSYNERL